MPRHSPSMPEASLRVVAKGSDAATTSLSTYHSGTVVEPQLFAPLLTVSKPGASRPSRFLNPGLSHQGTPALYGHARKKGLPHISTPRSPAVASSIADMSPGVMFSNGMCFTGCSRLRLLSSVDPQAKSKELLPKLKTSDAAEEATEDPSAVSAAPAETINPAADAKSRRTSTEINEEEQEEMLVASVGTGNHEQPGEGMRASASALAAPKSWGAAKEGIMQQAKRNRRASYTELMDVAERSLNMNKVIAEVGGKGLNLPPVKVLQMLGTVPWFKRLSNTDLRKMLSMATTLFFKRGQNILRENSYGTAFYVLLEGRVCASSTVRRIDNALEPGTCFGEAALASQLNVRREATITALEDSYCLRLTANDLKSFPNLDLDTIKKIYCSKLLSRVKWFDMLTPTKLELLGRIMEVESFPASAFVFNQGEPSDKMYILVSGAVGIFKAKEAPPQPQPPAEAAHDPPNGQLMGQSTDTDDAEAGGSKPAAAPVAAEDVTKNKESWASRNVLLFVYDQESKNPWFGETALFADSRPRGATAFTLQQTQLLSVNMNKSKQLEEILPEFFRMNLAYNNVYKKVNQLNGTEKSNLNQSAAPTLKARHLVGEPSAAGTTVAEVVSVR